ncbi:response regulator [Haloarcula rara]|uniref:response regulator n=1 Tax=Haloarcula rara TaxID=3033387 RepID=UPI0023E892BE|nr:response regulator [Halomicroarcula sp. SHR3]
MGCVEVGTGSSDAGESHRVLVVDDNQALAAVVAESLEQIDSELRTSCTTEPADALRRLREGCVDCLVTDYEMPDLDGLALVDRDGTDTPFVVFTQRRDDGIARAVADRGGAYLRKGASREQYRRLATLVRDQLGR